MKDTAGNPFQEVLLKQTTEGLVKYLIEYRESETGQNWDFSELPNDWINEMITEMEVEKADGKIKELKSKDRDGLLCKFCPEDKTFEQRFSMSWQRNGNWNKAEIGRHVIRMHPDVEEVVTKFCLFSDTVSNMKFTLKVLYLYVMVSSETRLKMDRNSLRHIANE